MTYALAYSRPNKAEPASLSMSRPSSASLPKLAKHIQLRPLRTTDLREFHAYRSDPLVARYQGWSTMSHEQTEEFLRNESEASEFQAGKWTQIGICTTPDDELIGDAGLFLSSDKSFSEFGLSLTPRFQGKGLGTEVITGLIRLIFDTTPCGRIIAYTDVRNLPCIRALQRAGMTISGAREETYKGELCKELLFEISRSGAQL